MKRINKLAEEFSQKIIKEKLNHAFEEHKGHGINVLYGGRHFGWCRWDGERHDKFSIGDFKDKIPVGTLEDVVAALKVVNLEDY